MLSVTAPAGIRADGLRSPPVDTRPPDAGAETLLSHLEIVLDQLAEGTVVIDAAARVLHANRRARELLAVVRDSSVPSGRLAFHDERSQSAFTQALRALPEDSDAAARPRGFLVRTGTGQTIARAWVEPLHRRRSAEVAPLRYLVSLHHLPQHACISTATLQALYGLTPSEARVAAEVVGAASLAELSARLELSPNTIKTHLRRTFYKCEVRSLAQLTALIATGPRVR